MLGLQHNLVNILYIVKGLIETYRSRFEEGRFSEGEDPLQSAHEVMQRIYLQAERAQQIAKRIGGAMREAESPEDAIRPVCIRKIWDDVLSDLLSKYSQEHLEVNNDVPDQFPDILCSARDLTEIVYCLVDNALQAMGGSSGPDSFSPSGKLIIRATLGFKAGGEEPVAHISIADSGPGIAPELLIRLFEPFVTTKSENTGNGLGLCLVRSLVRKNNGFITVSTYQNFGTTFTLSFPLAVSAKTSKINSSIALDIERTCARGEKQIPKQTD